jgi:hypothetical protein
MDLYHIYSVIKYEYVGVTDKRNTLAVDHQGQVNHPLPSMDQLEALQILFKIRQEGCLPCFMPPVQQKYLKVLMIRPCRLFVGTGSLTF